MIVIAGPNAAWKTTLAPFLLRDKLGLLEYVFWEFYQPLADAWAVYDNSQAEAALLIASGDRDVPLLKYDNWSWISFSGTKP